MRAQFILAATYFVVASAPVVAQQHEPPKVGVALEEARGLLTGLTVPPATAFTSGNREIAAGSTVEGPIAVIGTLRIAGVVTGDVYSLDGDVIVLSSGRVTGSAVSMNGHVKNDGYVGGDTREISGPLEAIAPVSAAETTGHNVVLTLGWAGLVLVIGIGVMVFGGRTLDVVGETVDQQFGKSFLVGIAATFGMLPVLALICIGLALTILGVLLIPFAIVAYILAAIGLVTLGFLAAMRVTGKSLTRRSGLSDRGASLRALFVGVALFLGLWLVAAIATPWPAAESIARVIAFAATWAAATVGLGATILSRAGARPSRRLSASAPVIPEPAPALSTVSATPDWVTPTPVSGVVAARRPTPPPSRS